MITIKITITTTMRCKLNKWLTHPTCLSACLPLRVCMFFLYLVWFGLIWFDLIWFDLIWYPLLLDASFIYFNFDTNREQLDLFVLLACTVVGDHNWTELNWTELRSDSDSEFSFHSLTHSMFNLKPFSTLLNKKKCTLIFLKCKINLFLI